MLDEWAGRSGEYSPDYYAYYGPNETSERLRDYIGSSVEPTATILELGCSSGRHLAHLLDHGYEHLHGIDVNEESFDVMAEQYPALADSGTYYADAIENVVTDFGDGQFDVVYSVETLQHVHPDNEWVFDELVRITDDLLVTVETEAPQSDETADDTEDDVNYVNDEFPLYYRDWDEIFTDRGLDQVAVESTRRDTLRAFRAVNDR